MRCIQTLGFTCITAFAWTAAADDPARPATEQIAARAAVTAAPPVLSAWRPRAAQASPDRLRYLDSARCAERLGCTTSAAASRSRGTPSEYDFIDSLSLGDYGPMKFKFTGDRVKMKVRF